MNIFILSCNGGNGQSRQPYQGWYHGGAKKSFIASNEFEFGKNHSNSLGQDGITRVVTVKTVNSLLRRPVTQVCPLPDTLSN